MRPIYPPPLIEHIFRLGFRVRCPVGFYVVADCAEQVGAVAGGG